MSPFTKTLGVFAAILLAACSCLATELKVATLNCYLCFDPSIPHAGQVAGKNVMSTDQFQQKTANLVSLMSGYDFIGLQEVGGREEISRLATLGGYSFAFAKGRDTYTGEEVGAVYRMPGWKVTVNGRVAALDSIVSKHLLVTASDGKRKVCFLVVHLIRPIGNSAVKHERQLTAIGAWAAEKIRAEPNTALIILGDTNDTSIVRGGSIFRSGIEAGEGIAYAPTHLANQPYDRLVLVGSGRWTKAEVIRPPYGKRPNDLQKTLWTDHFFFGASLVLDPETVVD